MEPEYMSSHQAARAWAWHRTTVTRHCNRGDIPGAHKDGLGKQRIPFSESEPEVPAYKLTEGEKREIARLAHGGENRTWLARRYNIERQHVYRLMRMYPLLTKARVYPLPQKYLLEG